MTRGAIVVLVLAFFLVLAGACRRAPPAVHDAGPPSTSEYTFDETGMRKTNEPDEPHARRDPDLVNTSDASALVVARFPRVLSACRTTDDCDETKFEDDCCRTCLHRIGNKQWVTRVNAYCAEVRDAGRVEGCGGGVLCSVFVGSPACVDGECVEAGRTKKKE